MRLLRWRLDKRRQDFAYETQCRALKAIGILFGGIEESADRIKLIVVFQVLYAKGEIKLNQEN